jgi:hypothetical protein
MSLKKKDLLLFSVRMVVALMLLRDGDLDVVTDENRERSFY